MEDVRAAIARVRQVKVHPHFQGYLAVRRIHALEGRGAGATDIVQYYNRYLRVGEPLNRKPYLQMFWNKAFTEDSLWFNENVQGSYALASFRDRSPFLACLREAKMPYELRENHAETACQVFCNATRLSAVAVATALLRDFEFYDTISPATVLEAFKAELGFAGSNGDSDFRTLFTIDDFNLSGQSSEQ